LLITESITSLESVLDLAIWLEKHGEDFYENASARVDDEGLKETFSDLANEERKHCAIYTDLYEMYTGKSTEGDELLGEYGRFIHLLIKEITVCLTLEEMLSREELIARALQFEKNTLIFFAEVKPLFRGKAGSIIDAICREEKRHIQRLLESREQLWATDENKQ
jgi:rubrerythrin